MLAGEGERLMPRAAIEQDDHRIDDFTSDPVELDHVPLGSTRGRSLSLVSGRRLGGAAATSAAICGDQNDYGEEGEDWLQ